MNNKLSYPKVLKRPVKDLTPKPPLLPVWKTCFKFKDPALPVQWILNYSQRKLQPWKDAVSEYSLFPGPEQSNLLPVMRHIGKKRHLRSVKSSAASLNNLQQTGERDVFLCFTKGHSQACMRNFWTYPGWWNHPSHMNIKCRSWNWISRITV